MKVLVASSDQLLARMASMKLENLDHSVTMTYDGNEALEHIESEPQRIVIADWDLPGTTGVETVPEDPRAQACPLYLHHPLREAS